MSLMVPMFALRIWNSVLCFASRIIFQLYFLYISISFDGVGARSKRDTLRSSLPCRTWLCLATIVLARALIRPQYFALPARFTGHYGALRVRGSTGHVIHYGVRVGPSCQLRTVRGGRLRAECLPRFNLPYVLVLR